MPKASRSGKAAALQIEMEDRIAEAVKDFQKKTRYRVGLIRVQQIPPIVCVESVIYPLVDHKKRRANA